LTLSNSIQAANSYEPFRLKTNLLESFFRIGSIVWIIVASAAILAMIIMYFLTKAELKRSVHREGNIYISAAVGTPTVYGIIKPRIVLPADVKEEQLSCILAHEKVHIRRHDNIWRMIAILTACIHWFNPLIWWFLKAFLQDTELACDMAAVKSMPEEERKNYAKTLLAFTNRERTVFASAFGSSKVRVRIEHVLTYRKLTVFSTICFAGMGIIIAFLLLTNAVK
jgi:beta-lactamase regulating signal transducer with metallopeptidase domain